MSFSIEFSEEAIGAQSKTLDMSNGSFVRELCNSRTFCRYSEVEALRSKGLALGGGLVFVGKRRWNIVLASGQVIMLPANNPEQAIQKILILDKAEQILSRQVAIFDFRIPSRITLRIPTDDYGRINSEIVGVRN